MQSTIQQNLNDTVRNAEIVVTPLPLVPEISLHLIGANYPRDRLPYDEMIAIMDAPAYWAFCWASGQVLARHVLDHASEFAGQVVLDFGCGSGVVAIAAAKAGATRVIACDNDPRAIAATRANAILNGIDVDVLADINALDVTPDIAIAADVLYDRDNFHWLQQLPRLAHRVLIADSRIRSDYMHGYDVVARVTATTVPDLAEQAEFNDVRVYRARALDGRTAITALK